MYKNISSTIGYDLIQVSRLKVASLTQIKRKKWKPQQLKVG